MSLIQFTDKALEAIRQYQQTLQIPEGYYLRVGIRQKNEANKRLLIGFDEKQEKDKIAMVGDLQIIYAPGEVFFFAGMIIDFVDDESRKGFTFIENKM